MNLHRYFPIFLLSCNFLLFTDPVSAKNSPFGVGIPEAIPSTDGMFGDFFAWVALMQSNFYKALTESVQKLKEDGTAAWLLVTLSFAYGVFHAVGPGHGKAIISTYVLANGQTLRRGIAISMASSMVQALSAVALIGIAAIVLNLTSIAITQTTRVFETGSYTLITLLGIWLLWMKAIMPAIHYFRLKFFASSKSGSSSQSVENHSASCGHSHAVSLDLLKGGLNLSSVWSVIAAIGMRPCSGALIVLVFSFSQGLVWAGVVSTLTMGIGTGLTVAAMACLAVGVREITVRIVDSQFVSIAHRSIEIVGAALVFLIGSTLLIASIGWGS